MEHSIKKLAKNDLQPFMNLLGEIECGEHYSEFNTQHIEWLTKKIKAHLISGTSYYGCMTSVGEVMGIVGLQIDSTIFTNGTAEVVDIGVTKSYRRTGLGSQLLDYAINLAKEASVPTIFARTYAADTDTIAFYGRNSFYPVAVVPETNSPDDEGTIVMRRKITADESES